MSYYSDKITYKPTHDFKWQMPQKTLTIDDLDEICETCDSIKGKENRKLKTANTKLKKLVNFLEEEIRTLELKTAVSEKAVPLKKIVKEFTSTPEGKRAWQEAWDERAEEWLQLANKGKISKVKYYRLINGMDQATLAKKLKTAQPNICRIEKPGYNVPVKTLDRLAKIFKVKKGDLIGD